MAYVAEMGGGLQWRDLIQRRRSAVLGAWDVAAWVVAGVVVALAATPDFGGEVAIPMIVSVSLAAGLVAVGVNTVLGVYSRRWEVADFRQVKASAWSYVPAGVIWATGLAIAGEGPWLLSAIAALAVVAAVSYGGRVAWRSIRDTRYAERTAEAVPIIVFGAGDGGRQIIEALARDPQAKHRPVAVLDDDENLHGREIAGLTVLGGRELLTETANATGAGELLIAIPSADRSLVRDLQQVGRFSDLHVSVLPTMAELVGRAIGPDEIRQVTPSDLLGRKPIDLDLADLGSYVRQRTVLVTGAGGSIGSELCRQLALLGPERLLMLDRDESALHALQLSIDGRGQLDSDHLIVADIRETERIDALFDRWQPDVVFHTAALKHLSLLERHPHEGVKTNVLGTQNLLAAAARTGVERFVNVSTDKAADPSSVLGWTKRLAERLTTQCGIETGETYLSVRFGNVLGSRGSVLPAFIAQIEAGGPVSVTHPDVTRYFMTVDEAASLVIASGANGHTGDVMILDMGEPVAILDVARELIARSGKQVDIDFTGLRPGEKLHEVLRGTDELIVQTDDGTMWRGAAEPMPWHDVAHLEAIVEESALLEELACLAGPTGRSSAGPDILMSPPEVGEAERSAVLRALDSGWIAPAGAELDAFETELADFADGTAALALNSGTAALHLGLLALGVKPGDEVVVQTSTFAASAFSVCHTGARPVFCDVDRHTGMMDPHRLDEFLRQRARRNQLPAAIMPVDLYGRCADYDALRSVADQYAVPILQDSAEALGARSQGRAAGSHGDLGVFSFNGNKIITTSGGGALVGPQDILARALKLATQAKEPLPHYEHAEVGFNYRMSNLLAAVGRAQLGRLEDRINERGVIATRYQQALPELEWFPVGVTEQPNNWLNVALLPEGVDAPATVKLLLEKGIEARVSWKPMHMQPVFSSTERIGGEVAEWFFERAIALPSSQRLEDRQFDRVVEALSLAVVGTRSHVGAMA